MLLSRCCDPRSCRRFWSVSIQLYALVIHHPTYQVNTQGLVESFLSENSFQAPKYRASSCVGDAIKVRFVVHNSVCSVEGRFQPAFTISNSSYLLKEISLLKGVFDSCQQIRILLRNLRLISTVFE